MLDTVKKQISELPNVPFDEFYQRYIFSVQDENIYSETSFKDSTFFDLNKLLGKIRRELGEIK